MSLIDFASALRRIANPIGLLLTALSVITALFVGVWIPAFFRLFGLKAEEAASDARLPGPASIGTGAVTAFFDTLGIGAFATTTAILRATRMVPDQLIPGTLNVGLSLPSILQAFIYMTILPVDGLTLALPVIASTLGAWLGADIVAKWPRRRIQRGMGLALLVAAAFMLIRLLKFMPSEGAAIALTSQALLLATIGHFLFGALMTLGIGLFAPSMILLSFLGLSPKAIFPIMMSACAFLMPVGGLRFISARSYAPRVALGLTLGGIPAVFAAAFLVKELPLQALRWIVMFVVIYTGTMLLISARQQKQSGY